MIDWLLGPAFRVTGEEGATFDEAVRPKSTRLMLPQFRLKPNLRYYVIVACGTTLTALPLLARTLWVALLTGGLLLWAGIHLTRLIWSEERRRTHLGDRLDLVLRMPSTHTKRLATICLLCVFPLGVTMTLLAGQQMAGIKSWRCDPDSARTLCYPDSAIGLPIAICFAIWCVVAAFWTRYSPTFRLVELEGRYRTVSETVKEKITFATSSTVYEPAQTWRASRSISQETHLYGQAVAFFSVDSEGSVWKRSLRAFIWYFAPVTVPLVILFLLPIFALIQEAFISQYYFPAPEKYELALAAIGWACWSIPYIIFSSERDYGRQLVQGATLARDVDIYYLGSAENRRALNEYLSGKGLAIFNLVVFAVVPLLCGYFDLFPDPPQRREPPETVQVSCSPVVKITRGMGSHAFLWLSPQLGHPEEDACSQDLTPLGGTRK